MPRNESVEFNPFSINPQMFGNKLKACTDSILCSGASATARRATVKHAHVSVSEVKRQSLPQFRNFKNAPLILNLGNYNLQGTGEAYRSLIHDGMLEVVNNHADTVKPV